MPQPVSATSIRTPLDLGLGPRADRDRAVGRAGVDGVHEQVDDDLVNPGGRGSGSGAAARARSTSRDPLLAGVALDHVHRRLDAGVQVDLVPVALVDPGEEPEVLDDPLDPPQALAGALDQPRQVVQACSRGRAAR